MPSWVWASRLPMAANTGKDPENGDGIGQKGLELGLELGLKLGLKVFF